MRPWRVFFVGLLLVEGAMYAHPAESKDTASWQWAQSLSVAALMHAGQRSQLELSGSLGVDVYGWRRGHWLFGPGLAFYTTWPFNTGNASVRVTPRSLYFEPRFTCWLAFLGDRVAVMPFVGIKAGVGAAIVQRRAGESMSTNTALLIAMGPRVGMAYWVRNWGFSLSYDLTLGSTKLGQELGLGVAYHWADYK